MNSLEQSATPNRRSPASGLLGQLEDVLQNAEMVEKKAARRGAAWHCYMVNATEYLRTAVEAERRCFPNAELCRSAAKPKGNQCK